MAPKKPSSKRRCVAYPCRVCLQDCRTDEASIMCDGCQTWSHAACLKMNKSTLDGFATEHYTFYCAVCATDNTGHFNFLASLARLHKSTLVEMQQQAESE